jgi:hypothetical protein
MIQVKEFLPHQEGDDFSSQQHRFCCGVEGQER